MVDCFVATHGETQIELVQIEVILVAGFAREGFDLERAEGARAA